MLTWNSGRRRILSIHRSLSGGQFTFEIIYDTICVTGGHTDDCITIKL